MRHGFTLDDLRLIRAIAAAGTLTGAARRLKVDHSTAFRRLGALERRVGAELFERARGGYTPTPAGDAAVAAADRILDDVAALEQRLSGDSLRPAGTVRLTTTDTLVELVTPILAALHRDYPDLAIDLVVANSFLRLSKRDADIALRPVAAAPDSLVGRRLAAVATAPYAAPTYLAGRQARLVDHDWLGFEDSLEHLRSARWLAANVPADRIVHRGNSLLALREAARAGIGVAALPCYLGDPDAALARIAPPLPEMEVSLWLLVHPSLRRVARVRVVLDAIAAAIAQRRPLIEGLAPPP
jgi:molybdate transport repressor ModE-like protein